MDDWAFAEMRGAAVWDRRCIRSLARICRQRVEAPLVSFSQACGNDVRQAATRILSHPNSTVDGLLRGHFAQTRARAQQFLAAHPDELLLVAQDTTVFDYTSHPAKKGLGPINSGKHTRGLVAHGAVLLPLEGPPLGLTHLSLWARDPGTHGKTQTPHARTAEPIELKESQKWIDGLWATEARLPDVPFLLLADREADVFQYFAAERQARTDLLVRARHARNVRVGVETSTTPSRKLPEVLADAPSLGNLEVEVPRAHQRPARRAVLELRSVEVWLVPPDSPHVRGQAPVRVWAVEAREVDPAVAEPIHWVLLTTCMVNTYAAAARMVRAYTRRWVIEELHLVLKSGLRVERLQLEELATLQNGLALHYVAAWRILHLRDTARWLPEGPTELVVCPVEQQVLEAVEKRPLPTLQAITRAIAHLGGFPRYPSAGEPGVRTLCAGLLRLDAMVEAWKLAKGMT